jgi:hypothetical protein
VHLRRLGPHPDIVAIEGDIQHADPDRAPLDPPDLGGQASRQVIAACRDADEHHALGTLVALEDLVRDARDRAPDLGLVHDPRLGHQGAPAEGLERRTPGRARGRASWSAGTRPHAPFPASLDRT